VQPIIAVIFRNALLYGGGDL